MTLDLRAFAAAAALLIAISEGRRKLDSRGQNEPLHRPTLPAPAAVWPDDSPNILPVLPELSEIGQPVPLSARIDLAPNALVMLGTERDRRALSLPRSRRKPHSPVRNETSGDDAERISRPPRSAAPAR